MTKKKNKKEEKKEPSNNEDIEKAEEDLIKKSEELEDKKDAIPEDNNTKSVKKNEQEETKEETKKETKEETKEEIKPKKLDIPEIPEVKIKIEPKEDIEEHEHYNYNPKTKIYTCKTCDKEYKRLGSCISHIKKIHYKGKEIKIDKKIKPADYVPIMDYKEFKTSGREIAIIIMNFLTFNIPLWIKLLIEREAFNKLPAEKKAKLTIFAQNLGIENIKKLEKTYPLWSRDFYKLLCDLRIFNIIFKIKYLALITTFVSCAKSNYQDYSAYIEPVIKPYKEVIDIEPNTEETYENYSILEQ